MPAVTALRTPPVVQGAVIAGRAQGKSKRKIARELGIDKGTVDRVLSGYAIEQPNAPSRVQQIIPLAYDAVEKALRAGDGRIGMDLLKATDLSQQQGDKYTINGDVQLQQALTLLPAAPTASSPTQSSTPSTPSLPSSTSTQGAGATEAAANPPGNDISLPLRRNFSQFSLADLEAEVARRKSACVIDAEVVEP